MADPKGGLAILLGPPNGGAEDDEPFDPGDYPDDMDAGEEDSEGPGMGAFEAYADVVFNPEADPAAKADALRQAIETVIEERGSKG